MSDPGIEAVIFHDELIREGADIPVVLGAIYDWLQLSPANKIEFDTHMLLFNAGRAVARATPERLEALFSGLKVELHDMPRYSSEDERQGHHAMRRVKALIQMRQHRPLIIDELEPKDLVEFLMTVPQARHEFFSQIEHDHMVRSVRAAHPWGPPIEETVAQARVSHEED